MISENEITVANTFPQVSVIGETRGSIAFESRTEAAEHVIVVTTKYKFAPGSQEKAEFLNRLKVLQDTPDLSNISECYFGIDQKGFGFLVEPWYDSKRIVSHPGEFDKVLTMLVKCARLVETFHSLGIVLGDICPASFRLTGVQEYKLISILGTYSALTGNDSPYSSYVSPEQKILSKPSQTADVYALGVLAYFLITGEYGPQSTGASSGAIDEMPVLLSRVAPSRRSSDVPEWFDIVIGNCLALDPDKRIRTANELLNQLESGVRNGTVDLPQPRWQANALVTTSQPKKQIKNENIKNNELIPGPIRPGDKSNVKKKDKKKLASKTLLFIIWGTTGAIGLAIMVYVLLSLKLIGVTHESLSDDLRWVYEESRDDKLLPDLVLIEDQGESMDTRIAAFKRVTRKKVQWDIKIVRQLIKKSLGELLKEECYSLPEFHAKKLGYDRVTVLLGSFIAEELKEIPTDDSYAKLLDLLVLIDPAENPVNRTAVLRSIFKSNHEMAVKFAGLLAIESDYNLFFPVLKEFIATKLYDSLPKEPSQTMLFLLVPSLRSYLPESVERTIKDLGIDELRSIADVILSNTLSSVDPIFDSILEEFLQRSEMGKFSKYFLDIATGSDMRDPAIKKTFYRLALETATVGDLRSLMEWSDPRWEDVINVLCVTSKNEALLEYGLDILSRRGVSGKTASSLLQWIRTHLWQKRARYAYSYGIFVLRERSSPEEVEEAFSRLMPVSQHGLFAALLGTEDSFFINEAVSRIGPIVSSNEVVPLLSHNAKDVRMASIKALTGRNDIETLRGITRAYRTEKDDEVRKLYNKIHWVTLPQKLPESITSSTLGG